VVTTAQPDLFQEEVTAPAVVTRFDRTVGPPDGADEDVLALAKKAGFFAGATVDVLFGESEYKHIKTLTGVELRNEYGCDWLILRWTPGGMTPWGTESCGYGGWKVDGELLDRLRLVNEGTT